VKNAELINRRVDRRAAYQFSIRGSARNACIFHDDRNSFGNTLWKCTYRSHVDSTLHTRELGYSRSGRASERVCRVYSCPIARYAELKLLPSSWEQLLPSTIITRRCTTCRSRPRWSLDKAVTWYALKRRGLSRILFFLLQD